MKANRDEFSHAGRAAGFFSALDGRCRNADLGFGASFGLRIGGFGLVQALGVALLMLVWPAAMRAQSGGTASITVQADQPGVAISSNLFGVFFEEINSAGDGGIYAELVRNRNFEEPNHTNYWQFISSGATGSLGADFSVPLSPSNQFAGQLTCASGGGSVGVANSGWWGMNFEAGQSYDLSFYARCSSGFSGPITARLESADGTALYALGSAAGLSAGWQRFTLTLVPSASDANGRLSLWISQPGTVWLDMVSLFPRETFRHRTNGLRPDLANLLVNLHPSFMRFPGGSWVNGDSLTNMYQWKRTIGPLGDRLVQHNLWGYYVNNGLGYHEYLQMCEDLGAEPLFVINCGMDVRSDPIPLDQMGSYVQDALDAIEYANGPTNSTWGGLRAAAGHPQPFGLCYMEIGNENGGSAYDDRYALFYDAIKSNYPNFHIIADNWGSVPSSRPVEIADEHYYSDPAFFINNASRYDHYSRTGPKVYVGEYAVTSGAGSGNLAGALGEAAFMTGLERNADVVALASYAPLFANLNNKAWNPDLIYFTSSQVYGTPSYYVQRMFSENRGDYVLPCSVTADLPASDSTPHGEIGLGSWNTQVQYTNIVVTSNGVPIYQSDFTAGAPGWRVYTGSWSTTGGLYQQTALITDCRSTTGNTGWSNYTVTLRARKTGGSEGFLILFNWLDDNNWTWWNIGGWNNTLHGVEQMVNGAKRTLGSRVSGSVVANQWYDIRIVLTGTRIQCYLDDQLIQDVSYPGLPHGAVGLGTWNSQASFTNLVVANATQTLYQSDFSSGAADWRVFNGNWSTTAGLYQQTALTTDCRSTTGDTNWSNETITLRARKDGGSEGFLILFNWIDDNNWTWWNIGGWNNTQHAIEQCVNGTKSILGSPAPGSVETGRWYDIRIILNGSRVQCYLDGQLIHDARYSGTVPLLVSSSYARNLGQIILKAVNVSGQPLATQINLQSARGLAPESDVITLTSPDPLAENSLNQPTHVFPSTNRISAVSTNFEYPLPANSLNILRLQELPDSPVGLRLDVSAAQQDISTLSNGVLVSLSSFITNSVSVDYVVDGPQGVLATGTLLFSPGALNRWPPIPGYLLDQAIVRVTLRNPVNAILAGSPRAYFVRQFPTSGAPQLGLATFPDELLAYWTDPAATLEQSPNLTNGWTPTNVPSPFRITPIAPHQFFRLRK